MHILAEADQESIACCQTGRNMKIITQILQKMKQNVSQRFSILLDIVNDKKVYQNLPHESPKIQDGRENW